MTEKNTLSTESYKGVRDFYPEDMFVQKYIFNTWQKVVEHFGYVEYTASILEPAELYRAKSGEEIVNEQTYTFTDRGEREVTLRPEMTPTVARMVAARERDLVFPLRWYSIPNLFRYEKPQRGRLREHWQLNVDLFGSESTHADVEIITVASEIMRAFGAKDSDFVIKVNNRKVMNDLYSHFGFSEEEGAKVSKIIDKKAKISAETFEASLKEIIGEKASDLIRVLEKNERVVELLGAENPNIIETLAVLEKLSALGVSNAVFDPTLMRGFDYYTGVVFEVFDTHPDNNRSVFGGGRYDDLVTMFGARKVSAVGFGSGDVTARDFLEVHDLLPKYQSSAQLYICSIGEGNIEKAEALAQTLREKGLNVIVDFSGKKIGDQLKAADRAAVPYTLVVGDDEVASGLYPLKNMESGDEKKLSVEDIARELGK